MAARYEYHINLWNSVLLYSLRMLILTVFRVILQNMHGKISFMLLELFAIFINLACFSFFSQFIGDILEKKYFLRRKWDTA